MQDTSPKMEAKWREMMMAKSPIERLKMGMSMFRTSQELAIRFIKEQNPDITPAQLRQELFLKFYRDDFTEKQREKILKYLEKD